MSTLRKLFLTVFVFLLFSFSSENKKSVSVKMHGQYIEYAIHFKECNESRIINLADMVDNFEFVGLETNEESSFDYGLYYVSRKFILVVNIRNAILQFDRSGKFIRTLAREGPGPSEYSTAYDKLHLTVDEEKQILIISDINKPDYFLKFDLVSGKYLGNLPKSLKCHNQIALMDTNTNFMVIPNSYTVKDKNQFVIFWQDINGKFLKGIKGTDSMLTRMQSGSAYTYKNDFRYFSPEADTVYSINNFQLMPFITYDFGDKNVRKRMYEGRHSLFVNFESSKWLSIMDHIVDKARRNIRGQVTGMSVHTEYYMLDKQGQKLYKNCQVFFDPVHLKASPSVVEGMTFQPNGLFNLGFKTCNFLKYSEAALKDPSFKEPYRSMLKALNGKVSKEDSVVLLIGTIK